MTQQYQPRMTAAEFRALQAARRPRLVGGRMQVKAGVRPDISPTIRFRSAWEANYARYLNLLQKMGVVEWWKHESKTFWFEGIKRGTNSYKPDFEVKYVGDPVIEFVEIKGHETPKDRTKWRRMAKYHPGVKLVIIGKKEYNWIRQKWAGAIPAWE